MIISHLAFCSFLLLGLMGIPARLLSLPYLRCLKIGHHPLCKNRRGHLRDLSPIFSQSCKLLVYFSTEFESQALRVRKFCNLFLWSKLLGVVIHMFPVVHPLRLYSCTENVSLLWLSVNPLLMKVNIASFPFSP